MSTLILSLPLPSGAAASGYDYVLSDDGLQVNSHGHATAAMLPGQATRGSEVVALIPARALSWHSIALPQRVLRSMLSGRMEPARARVVLAGVLEEMLLDEPQQLHFAVFAAAASDSEASSNAWVAACDRVWLQAGLQALETAGLRVGRIVAECTPASQGGAYAVLTSDLEPAQLLLGSTQGVTLLPLCPASLALAQAQAGLVVRTEPSVAALAEKSFGTGVILQTRAQRMLQAAQSPWNLAQMELTASAGGRFLKRVASGWQQVRQAPQWRPVRWGLVALLLVQLVGLNALAWRQRSLLQEQRAAVQGVLQQTFPDVQLVVNAPLQMQREVEDLARTRGMGAQTDLKQVMALVTPLVPKEFSISAIELSGRQVRLTVRNMNEAILQTLAPVLSGRGLRASLQDGQLLIEPKEPRL